MLHGSPSQPVFSAGLTILLSQHLIIVP